MPGHVRTCPHDLSKYVSVLFIFLIKSLAFRTHDIFFSVHGINLYLHRILYHQTTRNFRKILSERFLGENETFPSQKGLQLDQAAAVILSPMPPPASTRPAMQCRWCERALLPAQRRASLPQLRRNGVHLSGGARHVACSSKFTNMTEALYSYVMDLQPEPRSLRNVSEYTKDVPAGHMKSSPEQVRLFALLLKLMGARR